MTFLQILQWISFATSANAAVLAVVSARVRIPPITVAIIREDGSIQRPAHERAFKIQACVNLFVALSALISVAMQGAILYLTMRP